MTQSVAAVILAAGLSRRMGQPKMLLPWGQTTVLGQVLNTFAEAGVREIVVVTGGARQAIEAELTSWALHNFPISTVYNPEFETGEMLSSIQYGLGSLGSKLDSSLIGLGDQPQLSLAAIQAVISAEAPIIVPSYNMRRGHPWLVGRQYWKQLLELKPHQTTRDFLNEHASEIQYVPTDLTVLKDLDTPEEYRSEKP